jgi:hypothetical protein
MAWWSGQRYLPEAISRQIVLILQAGDNEISFRRF